MNDQTIFASTLGARIRQAYTPELRKAISAAMRGKRVSPETRERMRAAQASRQALRREKAAEETAAIINTLVDTQANS